jgi:ankyrin repeat protein
MPTVRYLVDEAGADIDTAVDPENGFTLVQTATFGGHKEIVRFFIKRGADVRANCNFGVDAAHMAANGDAKDVELAAYLHSGLVVGLDSSSCRRRVAWP